MHNYLYLEQENGTGVLSFLSSVYMLEELETLETKFAIYKGVLIAEYELKGLCQPPVSQSSL